jgi:2-dehydropantoate 2-reductase
MPPRILVFGTGSVGATYGYVLSKAVTPSNIVTVCRSNYDAALANGFTIHSNRWGRDLNYKPHIVVTSKILPSNPFIPSLLQPVVSASTSLVLIQNGIRIEDAFATMFPENPILSCTTYLPVTQTSPAVIEHEGLEHLHIGTYPANGIPATHRVAAEDFAQLIRQGGASVTVHDDIQHERWTKLLANASWNPISALSRSRDAQFLRSSPHAAGYVRDVMREVAAVARAEGYEIGEDAIDLTISRSQGRALPGVEPSMLADAVAGREMEVDAIVGNVVRIAEERGVEVPLLTGIYALLRALDESLRRDRERKG